MATTTLMETLLKKARGATQEDIDGLCSSIAELMSIPDRSGECCGLMRQLFVILQVSEAGAEPCISHKLLHNMLHVVSTSPCQKGSGALDKCRLCHMIISELLPDKGSNDPFSETLDSERPIVNMNILYLLQGKKNCLEKALPEIIRWLQSQEFDKQRAGLAFLTAVSILHNQALDTDATSVTSERLSQWLSTASVLQAPNPHAINPFRKDEESNVTEIDGTASTNIFTALNIGQYYTEDQLMNIFSFSVLYKWLLGVNKAFGEGNVVVDEASQQESVRWASDGEEAVVKKVLGALLPKSVDYCLRVIDQSERKAKAPSDADFQVACLIEAVQVLDMICAVDKDQTARVFQEVKRLNTRLTQQSPHSPALVYVLKFFFHHSTLVVHDPRETFKHFFVTVIASQFKNHGLMYDTVEFLYENLAQVAETTDILTDYFPNLFKILAWHPRIYMSEFSLILPAVMNWDTSVEIFHLLLDLPCMTAALEVIEKSKKSEPVTLAIDAEPTSALEAFYSPRYRPLFTYITRCEGGQGDTIDRLSQLHVLLRDCMSSTRVMVCAQLVPVLLKIWFDSLLESEDPAFIGQLLPVIIERSGIMFAIPELIEDVHKIFSDKILILCKAHPMIITRQQSDICEFLQTTANMAGRVTIYSNLIYAVGEYSSQTHSPDCTSEVVGKYYECLEVVTYELLSQIGAQDHDASIPKVISCLMSAVSKLASRSQDLIPRAILCLTKVAKQQNLVMLNTFTKDFLTTRAKSLIAVLKNPDTASLVLSPNPDMSTGNWHRNNTSIASITRGIHTLIKD